MLGTVCPKSVSHISIVSVFYTNYLSRICAFSEFSFRLQNSPKMYYFQLFFILTKNYTHPLPPARKSIFWSGVSLESPNT